MILAGIGIIQHPPTFLLDLYSGAERAYSVRKLRSSYTGSALRVRRSSDNSETDIGFIDNYNLDTAALLSFCGAGNGFVTTWYDQSGNAGNATQTTAGSQPQIVSSGSLLEANSKPTILMDGTNDFFNLTSVTPATNWSIFGVGKRTAAGTSMSYLANTNAQICSSLLYFTDNSMYLLNSTVGYISSSANTSLDLQLNNGFVISNAPDSIYRNNVLLSTTLTTATVTQGFDKIGFYGSTTATYSSASFSEIILYQSNQTGNRIPINTDINNYYTIY
jgi:hypothetical protein